MIQINNINDKAFEIIGFGKTEVKSKVYTCEVQGTKLMLRNANDRDDILVEFLDYTLYTVDSATFASIDLLQAALVDVVFKAASGGSGAVWGEITGTLSTQTDVQNALNDKSEVNSTSSFVPYNESGSFEDSPFEVLPVPEGFAGLGGFQTKMGVFSISPGNVSNYNSYGVQALAPSAFVLGSVSLGDYGNSYGLGSFKWGTGGNAPSNASYIKFDTYGYDLFECTYNYFKLDAKTGNPSRVDGLLFNTNAGGLGFGKGLDINSGSTEESIYWNLNTGDFTMNGVYGMECFYNSPNEGKTYLSQSSYDLGIWSGAMYISDNLTLNAQPTVSTKVLRVRDSNGNSFHIKLYNEV